MPAEPAQPFATEKPESDRGAQNRRPTPKRAWGDSDVGSVPELGSRQSPGVLLHLMYAVAGAAVFFKLWQAIGLVLYRALVHRARGCCWSGAAVILARRRAIAAGFALVDHGDRGREPDAACACGCRLRRSIPGPVAQAGSWSWPASWMRGTSLPDALARQRKIASKDAVLLTRVGDATGQLPRGLADRLDGPVGPAADLDRDRFAAGLSLAALARFADGLCVPPLLHHAQVRSDLSGFRRLAARGYGHDDSRVALDGSLRLALRVGTDRRACPARLPPLFVYRLGRLQRSALRPTAGPASYRASVSVPFARGPRRNSRSNSGSRSWPITIRPGGFAAG